MKPLHTLALLALAATAAGAELRAGPWQVWNGRCLQVGVSVPGSGSGIALAVGGQDAGPPSRRRPLTGGATLLEWQVQATDLPPGGASYAITWDGLRRSGHLTPPPAGDEPARLAVAVPRAWPRADQVERLGTVLGGPVQAVLVIGDDGLDAALGQGGWEADLPVLALALDDDPAECLGPAAEAFPRGAAWGMLGLPGCADLDGVATAIGSVPGRWQVFVLPGAPWDPSPFAARERRRPTALGPLVRLANALRLPLILGGGELAGALTEPLAADDQGRLVPTPGGCRVAMAAATGLGTGPLPAEVATPFGRRGLLGLAADDDHLLLAMDEDGAPLDDALRLRWERWNGRDGAPAGGWGGGDPLALRLGLQAAMPKTGATTAAVLPATARDAGERLASMARPLLRQGGEPTADLFATLLGSESDPPAAWRRRLARHLLADAAFRLGAAPDALGLPAWVRGEAVLRAMADPKPDPAWWTPVIATTDDPVLVLAAVLLAEDSRQPGVFAPLVERLRRQGDGRTPLDASEVLQGRTVAAVFDSPYLSPTPLRPIALALRERLPASACGPIRRFIARHGEQRPASAAAVRLGDGRPAP